MATVQSSLDTVLYQLGDFGKYQCLVFSLISLAVILYSWAHVAFVFSAKNVEYRCKVPECDGSINEFQPVWLNNTVPYSKNKPKNCEKYQFINLTTNYGDEQCPTDQFDKNVVEYCNEYIYKTGEKTILIDYNLHCDENLWKLTLVGTVNTIGQFVGLPIFRILSDRYGRRTLLILGMVGCAICGIIRAFAQNYMLFLILEFLDATFLSGTYACCFILAVELVSPKKRVLAGTIICCCFAIGEITVAGIAWLLQSWRLLLLVLYTPLLITISYYWLVPESVRWLLSQKKFKEAEAILQKAAKVNKKEISQIALEKLTAPVEDVPGEPFFHVFKSKVLLLRFINACFCWISCAFLFYGLTLNSVALAGNSYLDFMLTALVEIPAYGATYAIVDRYGRRWTQAGSFFITAISCVVFIFISAEQQALSLLFYLLGKFGATAAFAIVYIISSEIFPTPLRHSLMGACSMFGRIGSMVSPQMPLLSALWTPLPLVLFTGMAGVAGLLTLFFPETLNMKLPDTIEEAENIGKNNKETEP